MSVDQLEGRRFIVNSADCPAIQEVASVLPYDLTDIESSEPFADFIRQLYRLRNTHGVAFTRVTDACWGEIFSTTVMMSLIPHEQESGADYETALRLSRGLSRQLLGRSSHQFMNVPNREYVDRISFPFGYYPGLEPDQEN